MGQGLLFRAGVSETSDDRHRAFEVALLEKSRQGATGPRIVDGWGCSAREQTGIVFGPDTGGGD
jgi:hypothetical protein